MRSCSIVSGGDISEHRRRACICTASPFGRACTCSPLAPTAHHARLCVHSSHILAMITREACQSARLVHDT
jgi:hypothetical protein